MPQIDAPLLVPRCVADGAPGHIASGETAAAIRVLMAKSTLVMAVKKSAELEEEQRCKRFHFQKLK